ncbi:MAG: glutamine amidotransferase-related protein [Allosphingosinicella sp.]|uniref:glutamine amidotransferase-related protein n=1 Tax=Allosphingosinicella sp. TaxID=2823234 RepID=UPI0039440E5F
MKLAILETGHPPDELIPTFGRYPDMFRRLLGTDAPSYDVTAGQYPSAVSDHDAYLVTGSPAGVYDPLPWIAPLKDFLRAAHGRTRLVGVCFGHQVMAEALGGRVEKSAKGWGVGLTEYPLVGRAAWMDGGGRVAIPASHQDQVTVQPPGTDVVAATDFTPFAALAWRDGSAISFQFHPEFDPAFARALIETRRDRLPDPDGAIASLRRPNDNARVGGWMRSFLVLPRT